MDNQFIGDLSYNKYGQPVSERTHFHTGQTILIHIITIAFQILIIGHHVLTGRETKCDKPLAVLEKKVFTEERSADKDDSIDDTILLNESHQAPLNNTTVLDTTVGIENKTKVRTEYTVRAIVTRKLVFKTRPKPIIANLPD